MNKRELCCSFVFSTFHVTRRKNVLLQHFEAQFSDLEPWIKEGNISGCHQRDTINHLVDEYFRRWTEIPPPPPARTTILTTTSSPGSTAATTWSTCTGCSGPPWCWTSSACSWASLTPPSSERTRTWWGAGVTKISLFHLNSDTEHEKLKKCCLVVEWQVCFC